MKKERTGGKKQKKTEKNERSLVITYLFSRCSLAITLFVTLCFPFPVTPKTFLVHSPFAQKIRENVGVDFFSNSSCLFSKFGLVFCHTISVSVTPKTFFVCSLIAQKIS